MQKYEITIKDNSIPEYMLSPVAITEYKAVILCNNPEYTLAYLDKFNEDLKEYIHAIAEDLNTDPENIQILSIKLIQ